MKIEYKKGNVLVDPMDDDDFGGPIVIAHVCNTDRVMGAGIAAQIREMYPAAYDHYKNHERCELGQVQLIAFEGDVYIMNMIAQTLSTTKKGEIPLSYNALEQCLNKAALICDALGADFVGPKFGSALAGGDWDQIEIMIERTFFDDQKVVIYDYVPPPAKKMLGKGFYLVK